MSNSRQVVGFAIWETVGIGIPNPRSVVRMPIPKGLTPEQLARLDAAFAQLEAEQLASHGVEPPHDDT